MKKKYLFLFMIIFVPLQIFAKPVTKEEAKAVAVNFYSFYAPEEGIVDFSVKEVIVNTFNNKNSFYTFIFNAGGFVIISADDNAKPILGYSFTNSASKNTKNAAFLYKLESYKKQIDFVSKLKEKNPEVEELWSNLKNKSLKKGLKAAGPLLNSTWNQSPVYNMYCPADVPTGCVATAMAQIMNYHDWPINGQGFYSYIPSKHPEYGKQAADFSATVYDWDNMPNSISTSSPDVQKQAIATLMYHCGVSVDMDYAVDGSGASSVDVLFALANYFSYDNQSLRFMQFDINKKDTWLDSIKKEIDNHRPVYYAGGSTNSGGHAWVCDGYNNYDFLHINWGWGGDFNGYFSASAMTPGTYDFTEYNYIIIGIKPGNPNQELLWTKQASGFETQYRGANYLSAIDKRIAWCIASDYSGAKENVKEFSKTINGGVTWNSGKISIANTTNYQTSMIYALDAKTAWVPMFGPDGGGLIAKTSDGGKTWTKQETATFSAPAGFPNVVHFWDANNGFCMGDPNGGYFEIYITTNGGTNWNRVAQNNIPENLSSEAGTVGFYDVIGDTVWFATNKGRIYRSINRGTNWEVFQTPIADASFEISFKNANFGIIQIRNSDDDNTAYYSNDGGETWNLLNYTGKFYNWDFKFIPGTDTIISCGYDKLTANTGVSYSIDNGLNFKDYADYYSNYDFLSLGIVNQDAIWAGSISFDKYSGGIWHLGNIPFSSVFSADKNELCITDHVNIIDNSTGSPDSWMWNFGEGADPATGTGSGPFNLSYSSEGSKTITLVTTKDEEEHELIMEDFIYISSSRPEPLGDITGNTQVVAGSKQNYLVAELPYVKFKWLKPSTNWTGTSENNTIDITFKTTAKSGNLRVLASNGCGVSDTSKLYIAVSGTVGIDNISNTDDYIVYPNPSKDKIFIKNIKKSEIQIISLDGKVLMNLKVNSDIEEINVSELPSGVYYIKIPEKNRNLYKPFSKI